MIVVALSDLITPLLAGQLLVVGERMRGPAGNPLGQMEWPPLPLFAAGSRDRARSAFWKDSEMGMRLIHAVTSRNAARALDAARLRSRIGGYEPCFETKGQWLPSQLEPPM